MEEHPRARLLRYIAEHTAVSVKQMKGDLGMSTGTAYHYLVQLEPILKKDKSKKYYLSVKGRLLLDRYGGNYSEANKALIERMARGNTAALEFRKYRSVYDIIASILGTEEPIFTIVHVVRKGRLPAKRAKSLVSFLKAKNLIAEVKPEDLPTPYSNQKRRRFLSVTNKGVIFLRRYRELEEMIR